MSIWMLYKWSMARRLFADRRKMCSRLEVDTYNKTSGQENLLCEFSWSDVLCLHIIWCPHDRDSAFLCRIRMLQKQSRVRRSESSDILDKESRMLQALRNAGNAYRRLCSMKLRCCIQFVLHESIPWPAWGESWSDLRPRIHLPDWHGWILSHHEIIYDPYNGDKAYPRNLPNDYEGTLCHRCMDRKLFHDEKEFILAHQVHEY